MCSTMNAMTHPVRVERAQHDHPVHEAQLRRRVEGKTHNGCQRNCWRVALNCTEHLDLILFFVSVPFLFFVSFYNDIKLQRDGIWGRTEKKSSSDFIS
jgi:hypothetical protein